MSKQRPPKPMSIEDRAKQFAPFAALTGFGDYIKKMEKIVVDKPDLSEESLMEMDLAIAQAEVGDMVRVIHYYEGECVKIEGLLSRLDKDARIVQVVTTKMIFDDLLGFEVLKKKS